MSRHQKLKGLALMTPPQLCWVALNYGRRMTGIPSTAGLHARDITAAQTGI
jgi:hypothetical protein